MVCRHDKALSVLAHHVPVQHLQHRWPCAVNDRHACQERGSDAEWQDGVFWRMWKRSLPGQYGIEIGDDGAEEPVAPEIAVTRGRPGDAAHEQKPRDLQRWQPCFHAALCVVVQQGLTATCCRAIWLKRPFAVTGGLVLVG